MFIYALATLVIRLTDSTKLSIILALGFSHLQRDEANIGNINIHTNKNSNVILNAKFNKCFIL